MPTPVTASAPGRRHVWHLDFTDDTTNVTQTQQPARNPTTRNALDAHSTPPGFPPTLSSRDPAALAEALEASSKSKGQAGGAEAGDEAGAARKAAQAAYKAAWAAAFNPVRSIITSAFALYMAGSSVHFFSVASTITVLFMHVRAALAAGDPFRGPVASGVLRPLHVAPPFVVHLALCCVGVALGLKKANDLGFLPTTESDYVSLLPPRVLAPSTVRFAPSFA